MKRFITYLVAVGFLALSVSPAYGVEKKKAETKKTETAKKGSKRIAKSAPKKTAAGAKQSAKSHKRTYDSFVDQNKNGIDDRKEKGRKKKSAQKVAPTKPVPKKAATDSTKKKK